MGKSLFITGAEKPIGRAIAIHAAEEGHKLILHSSNEEKLQELCKSLDKLEATYISFSYDIFDFDAYSRVIEIALNKFDKIDALINAESVAHSFNISKIVKEDFEKMWNINVNGVINGIQLIVPIFKKQEDGGDIVNIISDAGKKGFANWSSYCSTMFAVRGFALSIAKELAGSNVRVSNIIKAFIPETKNEVDVSLDMDKQLKPEDIAQMVLSSITLHKRAVISEIEINPSDFSR